jgi:hypothetical protein
MPRIKGKFCPLTDELGNDERFIIQSKDLDKLMYILVMYTCHMTYHKAPTDPRFYKIRFGLRAKLVHIKGSIEALRGLYKGLSWDNGKVSLINSATYRSQPEQKVLEVEENKNKSKPIGATLPAQDLLMSLKSNVAYKGIDIERELGKCRAWCLANKKISSMRRFVNWLNRIEKPMAVQIPLGSDNGKEKEKLQRWREEASPVPESFREVARKLKLGEKV